MVKVIADTNVVLRLVVCDDAGQQDTALSLFETAETVIIGTHVLCELCWVLDRRYGVSRQDIAATVRLLISRRNVVTNRPAAEAGLEVLETGGDFADGAIAYEGRWLGGNTFVPFDKKAVRILKALRKTATLLV